jgi:hypothetical protein
MFGLFRFAGRTAVITAATLAGNWAGEQIRAQMTGQPGHQLKLVQQNEQGETLLAANPVFSNLLPGLLVGLFRKPAWFWALIGGAAASALLGDRYEAQFKQLTERIPMKQ